MNEKTLLKIAIIISITGLVALYFISDRIETEEKVIENIDATDIEKDIKQNGGGYRNIAGEKLLTSHNQKHITEIAECENSAYEDEKFQMRRKRF